MDKNDAVMNECLHWLVSRTSNIAEYTPSIDTAKYITSKYHKRIKKCKQRSREELDWRDWDRSGYARYNYTIPDQHDTLERIDISQVSREEFVERFEARNLPVVVTGAARGWRAEVEWTPEFKVGEDDDGNNVYISFANFMHYCLTDPDGAIKDDSPLYIFDPNFGDRSRNNTANEIQKKRKEKKSEENLKGGKEQQGGLETPIRQLKEQPTLIFKDALKRKSPSNHVHLASAQPQPPPKKLIISADPVPTNLISAPTTTTRNPSLKLTFKHPNPENSSSTNVSATETLPLPVLPPSNPTRQLLQDYTPPLYFQNDLLKYTGSRRPPHRWLVVGPKRSGTGIHIDPLGTSAWNTLLFGHKRWTLFPPDTPKHLITPQKLPNHEPSTWYTLAYPQIRNTRGIIDIIQQPGETVFVPGGWHHTVMNLDFTVGVTQNFASVAGFDSVYLRARNSRPRLTRRLVERFRKMAVDPVRGYVFRGLLERVALLETVPELPPTSGSSASSSSSSSSSDTVGGSGDDTESESEGEDGKCMCRKCKIRRKRRVGDGGVDVFI